jgi:hypothetical protein
VQSKILRKKLLPGDAFSAQLDSSPVPVPNKNKEVAQSRKAQSDPAPIIQVIAAPLQEPSPVSLFQQTPVHIEGWQQLKENQPEPAMSTSSSGTNNFNFVVPGTITHQQQTSSFGQLLSLQQA